MGVTASTCCAVDEDIAVAVAFEGRDELHAKAHLRGPEPGEAGPREQMLADALPALELLVPVGSGDQRQDGMVVAGAQDADDLGVLQVPQQRPAVDDAVGAALEAGTGQGLQQGAGQRQVHPADIFVGPQRPGDPVHRPQDLPGLPLALAEQVLKVAGGLVQVEDQGEGHVRPSRAPRVVTGRRSRCRWRAGPVRRRSRPRCPRPQ